MDIIFLGVNGIGWEIYEWLCDHETVTVQALVTTTEQLDLVKRLKPEMLIAAGFGEILPPEILDIPNRGCINVHPGYLPHTRGYNPNVWSIVEDRPAGVSIHYMENEVDAGDVLARRKVESSFVDTGKTLYERMERAAVDLFKQTWPAIEHGEVDPIPQDDTKAASHVKQDFVDLCELNPNAEYEVTELLDVLRALTYPPFDNAYLDVDGERYFVEVEIRKESDAAGRDRFTTGY
jgi:methionyl-tRNA formyltransferase